MIRAADALAFVGGTLFEIGAYLGLLEAGNRGKELDSEFDLAAVRRKEQNLTLCPYSWRRGRATALGSTVQNVDGHHGRPRTTVGAPAPVGMAVSLAIPCSLNPQILILLPSRTAGHRRGGGS